MENQEQKEEPKKISLEELQMTAYSCTDKVLSDLKWAFMHDFTNIEACHHAGINPDTYYEWIKKSDEFEAKMEEYKSELFRKAKTIIADSVMDDNLEPEVKRDGAKWILERRQKKLYSNRTELTGEEGKPITDTAKDELKDISNSLKQLLDDRPNSGSQESGKTVNAEVLQE